MEIKEAHIIIKFLKTKESIVNEGYIKIRVRICNLNRSRFMYLDRSIYECLTQEILSDKQTVEHIDGNTMNNRFDNLWIIDKVKKEIHNHFKNKKSACSKFIGVNVGQINKIANNIDLNLITYSKIDGAEYTFEFADKMEYLTKRRNLARWYIIKNGVWENIYMS